MDTQGEIHPKLNSVVGRVLVTEVGGQSRSGTGDQGQSWNSGGSDHDSQISSTIGAPAAGCLVKPCTFERTPYGEIALAIGSSNAAS